MKPRTTTTRIVSGLLLTGGALLLGFACSGDDSSGPSFIGRNDAGTDQSTGAPDSMAGTGGGPVGAEEAGNDSAGGGMLESGAGDSFVTDAAGDGFMPTPTFDGYLNGPAPRVSGCDIYATVLPNPLPALP
jgi:hypothetical protein